MAFFQNPFTEEFRGNWVLGDRQAALTFQCPPNTGRGPEVVAAWNNAPFDLSGNDADGNATRTMIVTFCLDANMYKNWVSMSVDIGTTSNAAGRLNATLLQDIKADLDNNTLNPGFSQYFETSITGGTATTFTGDKVAGQTRLTIKQRMPANRFKFFIENAQAETVLRFNARAGVAELPNYFLRHSISERFNYDDANNQLVALSKPITLITKANPAICTSMNHGLAAGASTVRIAKTTTGTIDGNQTATWVSADTFSIPVSTLGDPDHPSYVAGSGISGVRGFWASRINVDVIANATTPKGATLDLDLDNSLYDYELLKGRSGIYNHQNIITETVGLFRILQIIEYPSGAQAGDLGRRIQYSYAAAGASNPDRVWETPYVLAAADIIAAD